MEEREEEGKEETIEEEEDAPPEHTQKELHVDPVGQAYPISHCSAGSMTPFGQNEATAMLEEEPTMMLALEEWLEEETTTGRLELEEETGTPPLH